MEKVNNDRCFKTIAIVLPSMSDYRPIRFGGMQQHFYNIAKYLSKFYNVIIFSSFRYKYKDKEKINDNLKVIYLYFPSYDFKKMNYINKLLSILADMTLYSFQILLRMLLLKVRIKAVIFGGKSEILMPSLIFKILKIKTIYFEGNDYHWNIYYYTHSLISWAYNIFVGKLAVRLADLVVAQSERIKSRIIKYVNKRIEVIPIAVDVNVFRPEKNVENKSNLIGFMGRHEKEKGADLLLKILDYFILHDPKIEFMILGAGSYDDEIRKRSNVKILKLVDRELLPNYINKARLFISCVKEIGVSEAQILACGKPIVTLDSDVNRKYIKSFYNGFLCMEDPADYFQAIEKILNNNVLVEKMSYNARKTAIEEFSIETVGEKWRKILES